MLTLTFEFEVDLIWIWPTLTVKFNQIWPDFSQILSKKVFLITKTIIFHKNAILFSKHDYIPTLRTDGIWPKIGLKWSKLTKFDQKSWIRILNLRFEIRKVKIWMNSTELRFVCLPLDWKTRFAAHQSGNSQNFLCKFVRFFLTLKCFYRVVINKKIGA